MDDGEPLPPPERGTRMKEAGTTWWGQRWLEALEDVLRGDSGRLARGRTWARAGRTHDLVVKGGKVTAKVTGHYVLGEALDRDPLLLFELRGRTKNQVLEALRAARGGAGESPAKKRPKSKAAPPDPSIGAPAVRLGKPKAGDYDKPREPLPSLRFRFAEPVLHGALLHQLGAPSTSESDASPADVLAPLVRAAAETARRIAMAEPSETDERTMGPSKRSARPRARKAKGTRR